MNKEAVYKKWVDNGRPWYHIDKSKEPTEEERKIILEMSKTYEVTDNNTGEKFTVIEHEEPKPQPEIKPKLDTATLMKEVDRLLQKQEPVPKPKQQTKQELELEQSKKQWEQYFREHPNKIPYKFPNLFDKNEK